MRRTASERIVHPAERGRRLKRTFSNASSSIKFSNSNRAAKTDTPPMPVLRSSSFDDARPDSADTRRKRRSQYWDSQRAGMPHRITPPQDFDWNALKVDYPDTTAASSVTANPSRAKKFFSRLRDAFKH